MVTSAPSAWGELTAPQTKLLDDYISQRQKEKSREGALLNDVYGAVRDRAEKSASASEEVKKLVREAKIDLQKRSIELEAKVKEAKNPKLRANPYDDKEWVAGMQRELVDFCCSIKKNPRMREEIGQRLASRASRQGQQKMGQGGRMGMNGGNRGGQGGRGGGGPGMGRPGGRPGGGGPGGRRGGPGGGGGFGGGAGAGGKRPGNAGH